MHIHTISAGHPLWEKTISYTSKCSWNAGAFLSERMRNNAFADWEKVIVAADNNNIVGFAVFCEKDGLPEEYSCTPFISLVFVDERYRGKRISEKLINHTIEYAKKLDYKTVYLKSEHRGLYEKYGFEKIGEFEPVRGPADQLFKINITENAYPVNHTE